MGKEVGEWLQQAALEACAAHQSLTAPSQEGSQLPRQAMRQLLAQRRAHLLGSLLAIVDALEKKNVKKYWFQTLLYPKSPGSLSKKPATPPCVLLIFVRSKE